MTTNNNSSSSNEKRKNSLSQKSACSLSQQESRSPGSSSSKSPFSLSRQGTLRSSHRRKHSVTTSLNLNPGRRSPAPLSPSGGLSPGFLPHNTLRSPLEYPGLGNLDRKSPTTLFPERRSPSSNVQIQGRRTPIGFYDPVERCRSPTSTVHTQDRSKSPVGGGTSYVNGLEDGRRSPTVQVQGRRSPIGFSQGLITCIPIVTPTDRRSPVGILQIPPITVSNPSETCAIIEKTLASTKSDSIPTDPIAPPASPPQPPPQERKERSVMREILAFVRKPSKKQGPTTAPSTSRTGRFAAAFSRAESTSGTPLLRQSTFSSSPAASSRAAKSAVTKQMSEVGFEPKMSLKILNAKMSLRLRRAQPPADDSNKKKEKKSSGDDMSDFESSDSKNEKCDSSSSGGIFELENIRFDKVGDSYIKHDRIREETLEDATPSPVQIVALSEEITKSTDHISNKTTSSAITTVTMKNNIDEDSNDETDDNQNNVQLLKSTLEQLVQKSSEPIYANLLDIQPNGSVVTCCGANDDHKFENTIQCPTFEIMPPSRRSSFDPPRSPFLENLRSPCDTDPELMNLNRLDSGGDSFEMVDTDKNRESSFESRYPSSSYTSFDISRYQSTSYDDQTSSFEIIDIDNQKGSIDDKKSSIDLRKSSIELVDIETFQRSELAGRKSSLETHFDYQGPAAYLSGIATPKAKRQVSEPNRCRDCFPNLGMRTHYSAPNRARSPLSNQTSSNYSSRDSYDSSFEPVNPPRHFQQHCPHAPPELKSPYADKSKQHFPLCIKPNNDARSFLCTDQRCASIFEPRPGRIASHQFLGQAGSNYEFEPPSPRRASSASPKHTFTFRIVLKKVDSSPDAICPSAERRRSRDRTDRLRRRDSRKKRLLDTGKSF